MPHGVPTDRERVLAHIAAKPSETRADLSASLGTSARQPRKTIDAPRSGGAIWRKGADNTRVVTGTDAEDEKTRQK